MTTGLAIAGVTAVLQYQLQNLYAGLNGPFPNSVGVSCLAPDQVQQTLGHLDGPQNQVNLFMHQVTHNTAWRNVDLPSAGADGSTRLSSPPLGLDLHYLLTVYASEYWEAEALLGYAVQMLSDAPVLARATVATALANLATPLAATALIPYLQQSGLENQIEMIKITPAPLGREEMAWLWTALKADYRPTYPFTVTVVLIQARRPATLALPVLNRDLQVLPGAPAQLLTLRALNGQPAAASTDVVGVTGEFLAGLSQVLLANDRLGIQFTANLAAQTGTSFTFVPDPASLQPAGFYTVEGQFLGSSGDVVRSTNTLSLAIAPTLPAQVAPAVATAAGKQVTVNFSPSVRAGQDVSLALSALAAPFFGATAAAEPFTGSVGTLSFVFPATLPPGPLVARLIVDGVPSAVSVNPGPPPTFSGPLVTV
ncbi:DUF4255 domain-containing protein [Variovorax sp. dw_954]|uniref:DUF4255 domain-containing protein n=1 Tax=Variovorax sp. dw_954 TaxID=2720078 RepID=UPI001BD32C48|nr:DUF4255 domain-containing protein [Variovorax sp. dw_954]